MSPTDADLSAAVKFKKYSDKANYESKKKSSGDWKYGPDAWAQLREDQKKKKFSSKPGGKYHKITDTYDE